MVLTATDLMAIWMIMFGFKKKQPTSSELTPRKYRKKKYWVREYYIGRNQTGAHKNVYGMLRDLDDPRLFKSYLRMNSVQLEQLLLMVGPTIQKETVTREPISANMRLVITLRFLATGESQQSLSLSYKCSPTAVHNIILETTNAISDVLKDKVFAKLTIDHYKNVAMGFNSKWNFPNCLGAIDGKHVVIEAPAKSGSEFFNYKKSFSLVLLAITDYNYNFLMCDIGASGRQSDGGIFGSCEFGKRFYSNRLGIPKPCDVADDFKDVPFVFVADDAFSLNLNMMKPYSKKQLTITERIFNYRLSRARRIVENSFGILTAKWRIFRGAINAKPIMVESIIKACTCLHNWLRQQNDTNLYISKELVDHEDENGVLVPGSWRKEKNNFLPLEANNTNSTILSKEVRNKFAKYFVGSGAVDWQYDKI